MTTWLQELRFALRQLRKSPGSAIAAVLTLAGSNRIAERLFQAECLGKALKGNGWRGAVRHNSAVSNILRELRALQQR